MVRVIMLLLCMFVSTFAGNINRLLPQKKEISPWQPTEPPTVYKDRQLFDYINGGADIYLEYGFEQVLSQEYAQGEDIVMVDIYEMSSPEAAFGIYSCNRNLEYPALNIGDDGFISEYQVTFWQDKYYVVVMGYKSDEASHETMKHFARKIAETINHRAKPPRILRLLPKESKIHRSECYITGLLGLNSRHYFSNKDLLKFDSGQVQSAFASYSFDDGIAEFLLVRYENTAQADRVMHNLQRHYEEKYGKLTEQGSVLLAADEQNRFYSINKIDNVIAVCIKASNQNVCLKLSQAAYQLIKQ